MGPYPFRGNPASLSDPDRDRKSVDQVQQTKVVPSLSSPNCQHMAYRLVPCDGCPRYILCETQSNKRLGQSSDVVRPRVSVPLGGGSASALALTGTKLRTDFVNVKSPGQTACLCTYRPPNRPTCAVRPSTDQGSIDAEIGAGPASVGDMAGPEHVHEHIDATRSAHRRSARTAVTPSTARGVATSSGGDVDEDFRMSVMRRALDLFATHGYEATTVDQIAEVSGISRRTYFRQFRAKEDVVFADHDHVLARVSAYLDHDHPDPIEAVCRAAEMVFSRFLELGDLPEQRYRVVREVPTLRDREILMITRYERVFLAYLRRSLPVHRHLAAVQFAAAVTATHNWLLRRMVRGEHAGLDDLRTALAQLANRFAEPGAADTPRTPGNPAASPAEIPTDGPSPVVVAVFPAHTSSDRITEAVERALREAQNGTDGTEQ